MDTVNSGARLAVSTSSTLSNPVYFNPTSGHATSNIASFKLTGLTESTQYHYAVEQGGVLDTARQGKFKTFPSGTASFTFAFSACAYSGSNNYVFDHITSTNPLFYMNVGDFHYNNVNSSDPAQFRAAYDRLFA